MGQHERRVCSGWSRSRAGTLFTLTATKQSLGRWRGAGSNVSCTRYRRSQDFHETVHAASATASLPLDLAVPTRCGPSDHRDSWPQSRKRLGAEAQGARADVGRKDGYRKTGLRALRALVARARAPAPERARRMVNLTLATFDTVAPMARQHNNRSQLLARLARQHLATTSAAVAATR